MSPAPKKNQFWKQRTRHGRERLFTSPEQLWNTAAGYFEWSDANPWIKWGWAKNGAKPVSKEIPRPYTMYALCLHLGVGRNYFGQLKRSLPEGEQDFSRVITRIEDIIYTQKFEGAAVGIFNARIIARDLGLANRSR